MEYTIVISRIEKLCQARGINKTTAYVQSGVGKDFGSNIKKGNIPSSEKISALADYLNCSTDYLLGRTPTPEVTLSEKEQQLLEAYKAHPELQLAIDKLLGIEETEKIGLAARSDNDEPIKTIKAPKSKIRAALEDDSIKSDDDL